MFVRWTCGCVGLLLEDSAIVIDSCDDDDHYLSFTYRDDLKDSAFESLPSIHIEGLMKTFSKLLADGYRFQKIRALLTEADSPLT